MATAKLMPILPAEAPGAISSLPDPEVPERARRRRRFTAVVKLRILREADSCKNGVLVGHLC